MKSIVALVLALTLVAQASTLSAQELVSGPQVGEPAGGYFDFSSVKCGGTKFGSYVNFLGDDYEQLKTAAAEFGEKHKINHVPLMVPGYFKDGPKRMRIHPDAQVTVIIYQMKAGQMKASKVVKANHAFAKGSLNRKAVTAVIADIKKHLQ